MIITQTVIQVNTSVSSIFERGANWRPSMLSSLSLSLSLLLSDSRAYFASDISCCGGCTSRSVSVSS